MPELWPHQRFALQELERLLVPGATVCLTSPTGMGKTTIFTENMKRRGHSAILYTNRKALLEQTARKLEEAGLKFGVRAATNTMNRDFDQPIQLASIQTEDSRTIKRGKWTLHKAKDVYIDEAHVNASGVMEEIIKRHLDDGASICGVTATPLGIGHLYEQLIVAGSTSEGRKCGALVAAYQYGPDEPDTQKLKRQPTGEYSQGDVRRLIMSKTIFGRVIKHWMALNPEGKPTLLFAPGVEESLWFAEQLCYPEKRVRDEDRALPPIPAAHIDGDNVWMDGQFYKSDEDARKILAERSRSGEIKIVCNRFVMREGIDWPWLECGIFATIFGALTSFLQSGGRLLRASPSTGKERCVTIDHGGNWWRHGSLNSDREWSLDRTDYQVAEVREERMRRKQEFEPIRCPKCTAIRSQGARCPTCGFEQHIKSRMVVQLDGRLKEMAGDIFKPRRKYQRPDIVEKWKRYYFRGRNSNMTFRQLRGLFAEENNYFWPPDGLPLMPKSEWEWFRQVKNVPTDRLIQEHEYAA